MALQPAIKVEDGKVMGAYAAQAKNVSYGSGSVEDALDARPPIKVGNTYVEGVVLITARITMSFTNGVATYDMSAYKPADKTWVEIAVATMNSTGSLYITGSAMASNGILTIKCNSTYTGDAVVNIIMFCR